MFSLLACVLFWTDSFAAEPATKRGFAHARVATFYDSDILIAPDSMFDQGEPSHYADYRLLTAGDLGYAFVAGPRHSWIPLLSVDLINTAQARHAAGDPYRFALSAPYTLDSAAYRLVLRPTLQSLMMDPTLTTQKSIVQESKMAAIETTWRSAPAWSTEVDLEYRNDLSGLRSSVGADDGDANKLSAYLAERWSTGQLGTRAFKIRAGYVANQARGANHRYRRTQITLGYEGPMIRRTEIYSEVGAYRLDFPRAAIRRRDTNLSALLGLRAPLGGGFGLDVNLTYARNQDPVRAFSYGRFAILTALTYAGLF